MKVLLDIPREVFNKAYNDDMADIDICFELDCDHKSEDLRTYHITDVWTNDGGYKKLKFVTMDD